MQLLLAANPLKLAAVADQTSRAEQAAIHGGDGRNRDRDTKFLPRGRGIIGFQLASLAAFAQYGVDFLSKPRGQVRHPVGINRGIVRRRYCRVAEDVVRAHPGERMEPKNFFGRGIGLLYQPVEPEYQHSRRKIREYGLAEVLRGPGPALFGERLYLQLVFLLFELLDNRVVEVKRQSFKRWGGRGVDIGFSGNVSAQAANQPDGQQKCATRRNHYERGSQNQRIGEQPYHQKLPYHRKNWLPTKSASNAMLPKKTPKGIW